MVALAGNSEHQRRVLKAQFTAKCQGLPAILEAEESFQLSSDVSRVAQALPHHPNKVELAQEPVPSGASPGFSTKCHGLPAIFAAEESLWLL